MGLEAASFIPELVDTNPLGNDPKSQGDDHLRLVKTAVQGSFPAFVGTAGVPASVSLTEDEINDAALKSAVQTITGRWLFEDVIETAVSTGISGFDGAVLHNIGAVAPGEVSLGSNLNDCRLNADAFVRVRIQGSDHSRFETSAIGGVLTQDLARLGFLKMGFRNPRRFSISSNQSSLQDWEGAHVTVDAGSVSVTMEQLEVNTKMRIFFTTGNGNLLEGAGMVIQYFDGTGRQDGDIATSLGTVWDMWMVNTSIWYALQITS